MYAVTAATGQLGRLVVTELLNHLPAARIVAAVRSPARAADLAAQGVQVRAADYDRPETLGPAFEGVSRLLLISSSEVGSRRRQHGAVIEAAKAAGVGFIAYTSLLHADTSPLALAAEHRDTEALLAACGLAHALLRNGWSTEHHPAALPAVLYHGALLGAAGSGRIASAARADYAAGAAAVLLAGEAAPRIHELAGDEGWTLAELAAEIGRQVGREIAYVDLPQAEYAAALKQAGVPGPFAELLADADAGAAKGALFDDSRTLSRLIGRPTTPLAASVAAAVRRLRPAGT
jgi:NAD(P)H dehydrogenase (quinone)